MAKKQSQLQHRIKKHNDLMKKAVIQTSIVYNWRALKEAWKKPIKANGEQQQTPSLFPSDQQELFQEEVNPNGKI